MTLACKSDYICLLIMILSNSRIGRNLKVKYWLSDKQLNEKILGQSLLIILLNKLSDRLWTVSDELFVLLIVSN